MSRSLPLLALALVSLLAIACGGTDTGPSGSGGAGGAGTTTSSSSGEDCHQIECFAPYMCVASCEDIGSPTDNGCCACPEGMVDLNSCSGAGGSTS